MKRVTFANGAAPCPFCHNDDPKMLTLRDESANGEAEAPYVRCSKCGARGPCNYQTREKAVERWNQRKDTT